MIDTPRFWKPHLQIPAATLAEHGYRLPCDRESIGTQGKPQTALEGVLQAIKKTTIKYKALTRFSERNVQAAVRLKISFRRLRKPRKSLRPDLAGRVGPLTAHEELHAPVIDWHARKQRLSAEEFGANCRKPPDRRPASFFVNGIPFVSSGKKPPQRAFRQRLAAERTRAKNTFAPGI